MKSFTARNIAEDSENRIHAAIPPSEGLPSRVVPASSLLCHLLDYASSTIGFPSQTNAVNARFLQAIPDGERLWLSRLASEFKLSRADGSAAVAAAFSNQAHSTPRPGDYPQDATGVRRPLSPQGLRSHRRLRATTFACTEQNVRAFVENCGMEWTPGRVPTAYLISRFVPYLAANFERQGPSLYGKVDITVHSLFNLGEQVELRGKVARVYRRNGKDRVDIETSWFDEGGNGRLWAQHTLVYNLETAAPRSAIEEEHE